MTRLIALAAKYFAVLALILAVLLAAVVTYHLSVVGELSSEQGAVHWFFAPEWRRVLAVALSAYFVCFVAAWFRLRAKSRAAGL